MEAARAMNPRRPDYAEYVRSIFDKAPFIRDLGVELRPGRTDRLTCRATVLKAGTMFHVTEAEVRSLDSRIAKMTATVALVPADRTRP